MGIRARQGYLSAGGPLENLGISWANDNILLFIWALVGFFRQSLRKKWDLTNIYAALECFRGNNCSSARLFRNDPNLRRRFPA